MTSQPTIQRLAEKVVEARGAQYLFTMKALKLYLERLNLTEFEEEISRVTNPKVFTVLWAAGLSAIRQVSASKKWRELEER